MVNFFWPDSFLKGFIIWNWRWFQLFGELFFVWFIFNFYLCCPLTYSLPSGFSAQTLRRGRQPEFDRYSLHTFLSHIFCGNDYPPFHCSLPPLVPTQSHPPTNTRINHTRKIWSKNIFSQISNINKKGNTKENHLDVYLCIT